MKHEALEKPRRLVRAFNFVREGLPSTGRYRRYFVALAPALAAIWILTIGYVALAPKNYTSKFTLILPGSGMGGSMNVESIGQAQSSAASAFSSTTLSPTENYKRLLMADVTLGKAGESIGQGATAFPEPVVKLIDQTNLIQVAIDGRTAKQATQRALALRNAFLAQLERLRSDEAQKREVSDVRHIKDLELKVREAQRKLLRFQAENGLVSIEQFNNRIAGIDSLREKEREARTMLRQQSTETIRFSGVLGTGMGGANNSLRLKSDPVFQKLVERYAVLDSDAEQKAATLGKNHIDMAQANGERDMLRVALLKRGRELTGLGEGALMHQVDLAAADGRSTLLEAMVVSHIHTTGTGASLAEIRADLARRQAHSGALVAQASVLADLTRDHRVAEAVFSSALARLDTNKQDPFASYPLVQTLEEPSLPRKPSSPSVVMALGGAIAATLFLLLGFGLVWLRQPIIQKFFPSV